MTQRHAAKLFAWVTAGGLVAIASIAQTQAKPTAPHQVGVRFTTCAGQPFAWNAVLNTLRTELAQEGVLRVDLVSEADPAQARIDVIAECGGPLRRFTVKVHDARSRDMSRTTDLSDMPIALRSRGIALAVAELARTVWIRPGTTTSDDPGPAPSSATSTTTSTEPPPATIPIDPGKSKPVSPNVASPPTGASSAQPPRPATTTSSSLPTESVSPPVQRSSYELRQRGVDLGVAVAARSFVRDPTLLWGGRADLHVARLHVGIEAAMGARRDPIGNVTLSLATIHVGMDALLYEGATWTLYAGPRVSVGLARANAVSTENAVAASPAQEPYFDAAIEAGGNLWLSQAWGVVFGVEAGWARGLTVAADNRHAGALDGVLLGGHVGVGFGTGRRTSTSN